MEKVYLTAIKTPTRYFIRSEARTNLLRIDGKPLQQAAGASEWLDLPDHPKKGQRIIPAGTTNLRYILLNDSLESDKIPKTIPTEEVASEWNDDLERTVWLGKYANMEGLYTLASDPTHERIEDVEFEYKIIEEVAVDPVIYSPSGKERWRDTVSIQPRHSKISEVAVPKPILPLTEASLTSEEMYKIVRKFIQDNIDPKIAVITSDYDFCFTVKKKIRLIGQRSYKIDVSHFNAKKPKYETRYTDVREFQIFEMTHDNSNYKGYTPIKHVVAETEELLQQKVETFCSDLIQTINEPLFDCPCCKGYGVLKKETYDAYKADIMD